MIFNRIIFMGLLCFMSLQNCFAVDLELTQGSRRALPIALVPFKGEGQLGDELSKVIKKDLTNSGAFKFVKYAESHQPHNSLQVDYKYWRSVGINNLIVGDIVKDKNEYSITVQLLDPVSRAHIILSREYRAPQRFFRSLAHHISDVIYQQLTGHKGIFTTKLAYIVVDRNQPIKSRYRLEVSDYDGQAAKPLLISSEPIMSPSWSPDGKYIAYVSFENRKAEIYIVNVTNGKRQLITSYPGINGAPTWSPTGDQLSLVLSKAGAPKIYLYTFSNQKLERITDGTSIDTEPKLTPDGRSLIFTSSRGGSPQIYKINLNTKETNRITFNGNYNASASITPSNKQMVLLHRGGAAGSFSIALQELASGDLTPLTFSKFDESPSLSPNGKMVVYASKQKGKGILRISTIDGRVNFKIPKSAGDMQEPAWSPYFE